MRWISTDGCLLFFKFLFPTNPVCCPCAVAKFCNSKLYFAFFFLHGLDYLFFSPHIPFIPLFPLLLLPQPTRRTYPLLSASLGSLLARTTVASRSAGSVTETTTVWTTATRLLSCVVSCYRHTHTKNIISHGFETATPPAGVR